jgi:hypothetical protein
MVAEKSDGDRVLAEGDQSLSEDLANIGQIS